MTTWRPSSSELKAAVLALALCLGGSAAAAQGISGTVRDSTSQSLIPGVVVELRDAGGTLVGRTLTNAGGAFAFPVADTRATKMRVLRIGYRARELPLAGAATFDVRMVRLPTMLEQVDVVAGASCDQRGTAAGQALLQQARAGLLATIVGRETNPAKLVRLSYERTYGSRLDTMMPAVRMDSVSEARTSFRAVRKGADLVARGFTADSLGTGIYFGPDAETLLDEGFEAGYCFRVVPERRGQIGLGFSPAAGRRIGRVDVEGVLWIDVNARALRTLEYRYVGAGKEAEEKGVGGDVTYQEMPNGSVIVSRYAVRLLKVRVDSVMHRYSELPIGRIVLSEGGGMVARAEWPDGTKWTAPLGELEVTAVDGESGKPVPNAIVRIRNTNVAAKADGKGFVRFTDVFPGRYVVDVVNEELEDLGFGEARTGTTAARLDSAVIRQSHVQEDTSTSQMRKTVTVYGERTAKHVAPMTTTFQFMQRACTDPRTGRAMKRGILGHVADSTNADAEAVVRTNIGRIVRTRATGAFMLCVPDDWSTGVGLTALGPGGTSADFETELAQPVTIVRLKLKR